MFHGVIRSVMLGSAMWLVAGCGDNRDYPEMTPVSVTILRDGAPVAGATVILAPTNAQGASAQGITDERGVASVRTYPERPGVIPGSYQVTVSKAIMEGAEDDVSPDADPGSPPTRVDLLPTKYRSAATSGLSLEVPLGEPIEQTLELSD